MGFETVDELPFLLSARLLPCIHGVPLLPPICRYSAFPNIAKTAGYDGMFSCFDKLPGNDMGGW